MTSRINLLAVTLGVIAGGLVYWAAVYWHAANRAGPAGPVVAKSDSSRIETPSKETAAPVVAVEPPLDPAVLRRQAWDKVARHLTPADAASAAQIERSLQPIAEFITERKPGVRTFAKSILSLKGKWQFIRSKLPTAEARQHLKYLDRMFSEQVFKPDELRAVIEQSVTEYTKSLTAIENRLLVECRADIRELDPRAAAMLPMIDSESAFAAEYKKMLDQAIADVTRDVKVGFSREVVSLIGGEVAAIVALRVGVAVATKLGVDAGILGAGAASSWATFGVGLAAAIVLDIAIDWLMKLAGHDPVGEVAKKVESTLDHMQMLLIDGDPEAIEDHRKLLHLAEHDPAANVRTKCRQAVATIENSGSLGLRHELWRIHSQRSALRETALRRLLIEDQASFVKGTHHKISDTEPMDKQSPPPAKAKHVKSNP